MRYGWLVGVLLLLCASAAWADAIDDAKGLLGTEQHAEGVKRIRKAIADYEKRGNDAEALRRAGVILPRGRRGAATAA